MNDKDRNEFETRTRELFDREVAGLDAATRSQLNRGRQRALEELERPGAMLFGAPLPRAAAAALALAIIGGLLFVRGGIGPEEAAPEVAIASDIEILLAEDELEFLEDIEFYAWLEAQPEFAGLEDSLEGAG